MSLSRRKMIIGTVTGSTVLIAGCSEEEPDEPENETDEDGTDENEPHYDPEQRPVELVPQSIDEWVTEEYEQYEELDNSRRWRTGDNNNEIRLSVILEENDEQAERSFNRVVGSQNNPERSGIADQSSHGLDSEGWSFLVFRHYNALGAVVLHDGFDANQAKAEDIGQQFFEYWESQ